MLRLEDGEPPRSSSTVIPAWTVGEEFLITAHQRLRILAVDFDLADDLVDQGINAVFTVEPA